MSLPRTVLLACAATALLATGCSGGSSSATPSATTNPDAVPSPLASVPAYVQALSQTIGEYVVTPSISSTALDKAIALLKGQAGVQSATLKAGVLHVEILPDCTDPQRRAIEKQLAALGKVAEGF
jgi:hypothetical protein